MHFESQKQLRYLELKVDNLNAYNQGQMEQLVVEMNELKTQNQKLKTQPRDKRAEQNINGFGRVNRNAE